MYKYSQLLDSLDAGEGQGHPLDTTQTTLHCDGSVTLWDIYKQRWVRTSTISDELYATLSIKERARVERHRALLEARRAKREGGK